MSDETLSFDERCNKATGYFDGVEVEPLLEDSALVHVDSWNTISTLANIIVALNAVGKVKTYHDSLTSLASRATDGGRITLVVEPDPEHD